MIKHLFVVKNDIRQAYVVADNAADAMRELHEAAFTEMSGLVKPLVQGSSSIEILYLAKCYNKFTTEVIGTAS